MAKGNFVAPVPRCTRIFPCSMQYKEMVAVWTKHSHPSQQQPSGFNSTIGSVSSWEKGLDIGWTVKNVIKLEKKIGIGSPNIATVQIATLRRWRLLGAFKILSMSRKVLVSVPSRNSWSTTALFIVAFGVMVPMREWWASTTSSSDLQKKMPESRLVHSNSISFN